MSNAPTSLNVDVAPYPRLLDLKSFATEFFLIGLAAGLLALFLSQISGPLSEGAPPNVKLVEWRTVQQQRSTLVDARPAALYLIYHLQGAYNLPPNSPTLPSALTDPQQSPSLAVYGSRPQEAGTVARMLAKQRGDTVGVLTDPPLGAP